MHDVPTRQLTRPRPDLDGGVLSQVQRLDARDPQDQLPTAGAGTQPRFGVGDRGRRQQEVDLALVTAEEHSRELLVTSEKIDDRRSVQDRWQSRYHAAEPLGSP